MEKITHRKVDSTSDDIACVFQFEYPNIRERDNVLMSSEFFEDKKWVKSIESEWLVAIFHVKPKSITSKN
jgi:hypothetical protein